MALIKCPRCGKEMSDRAERCPHCGSPVEESNAARQGSPVSNVPKNEETFFSSNQSTTGKKRMPAWVWILIAVGALLVGGGIAYWFVSSNDTEMDDADTTAAEVEQLPEDEWEREELVKKMMKAEFVKQLDEQKNIMELNPRCLPEIRQRNVFSIRWDGSVTTLNYAGKTITLDDREKIKDYLLDFMRPSNNPNYPEREDYEIELLGRVKISKGAIFIPVNAELPVEIKDIIIDAFFQLRDEASLKYFNDHYYNIDESHREAINRLVPMGIFLDSEASMPSVSEEYEEIIVGDEPEYLPVDEETIIRSEAAAELEEEEDAKIYSVVENDPQFPGGMDAMYKYLAQNIKYPQLARDNNVTGKVYVTFVVERDGSLTNVKVLRDIGAGCGQEAVRVVKSMPKWKPGKHRGKAVRVQYNLPVNFNLK